MAIPPTGSHFLHVTFQELLHSTARLCQIAPTELGTVEAGFLTEYLNRAVKHAYDFFPWPETVRYVSLGEDDRVAEAGSMERADNLGAAELYPYEILGIYHEDPRRKTNVREYEWRGDVDFLWIQEHFPATAVMAYRDRPPEFTATAVEDTPYAAGQLVYVAAERDCFRALDAGSDGSPASWPAIEDAAWRRQRLPFYLGPSVVFMAHGDRLLEEAKVSRAQVVKQEADAMLEAEVMRHRDRQRMPVFAQR